MDARKFIMFWKSKMGILILFMGVLMAAVMIAGKGVNSMNKDAQAGVQAAPQSSSVVPASPVVAKQPSGSPEPASSPVTDQEKAAEVFVRRTSPLDPPVRSNPARGTKPSQSAQGPKPLPVATPPPPLRKPEALKLYSSLNSSQPREDRSQNGMTQQRPGVRKIGDRYAPFGRLVKCELVNTVDTSRQETPMIGLVTEDVWWDGKLIIPVGTEVHGTASVNRQNPDRIGSTEQWVAVLPAKTDLPHGAELVLRGVALDMADTRGDGFSWGVTDGSYGIQGFTIKSQNFEEVKLFVSTFLSEAANALQTRQSGAFGGSVLDSTPQNAVLNGTSAVLNEYAKQVMEEVKLNGSYTRVPAGKQFYLYVRQTVSLDEARIGDSDARIFDLERNDPKPPAQQIFGIPGMQESGARYRGAERQPLSPEAQALYELANPRVPQTRSPYSSPALPSPINRSSR